MQKENIEEIVVQARKNLENKVVSPILLAKLYFSYNPQVLDIESFINQSVQMFPKLNCGVASCYLRELIKGAKIVSGKYKNHNHTFLVLNNSRKIIDITADQYGGPKIYFGPLKPPWALDVKTHS